MSAKLLSTTCCIVGGGPAGMMLGLLLARAGVDVVVLEKHTDFFRDFRGDTIHPSTLDLIDQLGLRQKFDAIPHTGMPTIDLVLNGTRVRPVDFRRLRGPNREIVLMPQWDFLDLLADEARSLPNFHLYMGAEVTELVTVGGIVTGVVARQAHDGGSVDVELEVEAILTVAADGRSSTVRARSGLAQRDFGVPIDVLWFRLPPPAVRPPDSLGYIGTETMVVAIPRIGYYQTALLIPKGGFDEIRAAGIEKFRADIVQAAEFLAPVVDTLVDWDQVSLLTVQVNRLKRWHRPGLLCIGDAAHAMSPAFGVGINYAVQDAVATANLLAAPLLAGVLTDRHVAAVEKRRALPVRLMQPIQLQVHRVIARPGGGAGIPNPFPGWVRATLVVVLPVVRRVAARVVGRGFRPERIRPEILEPRGSSVARHG
jgi:2-polyprenyl-6-methoxyphenol hydroxylase-like FAD-dependent oxidoreductase